MAESKSRGQPSPFRQIRRCYLSLVSIATIVIVALAVWMVKPMPVQVRQTLRTVIDLAPDERFANLNYPVVAISPDGVNLVYVASRGNGPAQLFLRPLNALKAEAMAGTENATSPFFSPDSRWIGFFADGKLKKVPAAGGMVNTLCDASAPTPGGSWGAETTQSCFRCKSAHFLRFLPREEFRAR